MVHFGKRVKFRLQAFLSDFMANGEMLKRAEAGRGQILDVMAFRA